MKEYLLGALDERDAALLEERYFSDAAFFEWVRIVERELIGDYLNGRLSSPEQERFESRYLEIPALRTRLEEVRGEMRGAPGPPARIRLRVVLVALPLVCCVIFLGLLWRREAPTETHQNPPPPPALALIAVHLTPGVAKGPDAKQMEFTPPPGGRVSLSFELPGLRSPVECRVVLAVVGSDGGRKIAWSSGLLKSRSTGGSQEAEAEIDSASLVPADYIGQLVAPGGDALETYSFRITGPQPR